jgi:hypothetical protein
VVDDDVEHKPAWPTWAIEVANYDKENIFSSSSYNRFYSPTSPTWAVEVVE